MIKILLAASGQFRLAADTAARRFQFDKSIHVMSQDFVQVQSVVHGWLAQSTVVHLPVFRQLEMAFLVLYVAVELGLFNATDHVVENCIVAVGAGGPDMGLDPPKLSATA